VTIDLRPWRRLLAVWLPPVVVCAMAAAFYVWQTSDSGGRRSQIRNQIEELEKEIARLEVLEQATTNDRERVAELDREFGTMYKEVFGSLDERLTGILRSVGSATRSAGLLPGTYTYSAAEDRTTGYIRFGVRFSVEGEYQQLRRMLASLQSSPEFFVVETLTLTGDEDPVKRELTISVSVATFLAEADQDQLRRLTGGVGQISENGDG
jgi:Tfp pilus assembly protein PilO